MHTVSLIEMSNRLSEEKGMLIGEEKGMLIGEEKGVIKVARTMLAEGVPIKTISKFTGLDEETILELK
jgi:predicted transposase/invertase (TIGR01784 family)